MLNNPHPRAQWSSYTNYVLVTTGAVVGLGNIFKFPFYLSQYGGLFLVFFVLCEVLISLPVFFAELMIGRRGKQNPVGAISILSMESGASRYWRLIGWLCFIVLFLTLSYYTVAVAFPLSYLISNVKWLFTGANVESTLSIDLSAHFFLFEISFLIFLAATMAVIVRGINRGLEGISRVIVPAYFVILLLLAVYSSLTGDFLHSILSLFYIPQNQAIFPIFFVALTFAFFNLNVGMGSMMVYGSYLPYRVPLAKSTIWILLLDALASILSYFIIAPYQSGSISPTTNTTYADLMTLFSGGSHGVLIASFYFLVAVMMAWTPTIAMAESATLILIERFRLSRLKSTLFITAGSLALGTLLVFAKTLGTHIFVIPNWSIDDFIQNFASDIATPISALLIAIFAGWIVSRHISESELDFYPIFYRKWRLLIRYLAPVCIVLVLSLVGFS